jgi:hypothetical protein
MSVVPDFPEKAEKSLYFFPDRDITETRLRQLLAGPPLERSWAISHLLRFAQWEDIWLYLSREEVRDVLPTLELPENLRQAWARMLRVDLKDAELSGLKIETPVGG